MKIEARGTGAPLIFSVGEVARQAGGSVLVHQGDSVVLVTATAAAEERKGVDFLPLVVDYQEMSYAAGRIKGGFIKRDGRPGTQEILTARAIDRPIRPLFPKGFRNETQVIAMVLSADPAFTPDILALNGASAALHISNIPFSTPIGGARVGLIDGTFVIDPSVSQLEKSLMELIVVGTRDAIVMVEGEAGELPESTILDAIKFAHTRIIEVIDAIEELREKAGKPKMPYTPAREDEELYRKIRETMAPRIEGMVSGSYTKQQRHALVDQLRAEIIEAFSDRTEEEDALVSGVFDAVEKDIIRKIMKERKIRIDGRSFDEIRPIDCQVGILPRTHGSALFTRGETQALATTTLGTPRDEQRVETLLGETTKSFMLHYSFPPFSVGEVRMLRGPSRREIGHGNLAERALSRMLPEEGTFPYTIRLVSEILESNGSSSMATVCGGSLSLMDAGVPLKKPVAGIAMGLIKEDDEYMVLTDILGDEDHLGDMDFKVAGTADGVTALQMDIKISGIPDAVLGQALEKAKAARLAILDKMNQAISAPRADISPYAPRVYTMTINPDKIRDVIGPGGKIIKDIIAKTDTKIEIDDSGRVDIFSPDEDHAKMAVDMIQALTKELEVGRVYSGKVVKIMDFGAFVDFPSGESGLVHISQLSNERVKNVRDVVQEGDEVIVKVIGIDSKTGKIRLSRKEALNDTSR
ncbi:MAG: polyribonucleotide nucleotidyltransferase [Desulfomonilia bacterium]|jgi:polyribonucleotide nucleotidyltransferase|uniref:polyribonucleotide nucleotidyltransferase n=1 Tax=anaerobic digester metagenome TaxID=1263854 RepID=A0A485M183_9ZZZZ|nr:polyribonucleotide nucleotidyltransferase [Pseudomonadota bacterium]HON39454.1 polyribonucleotide nucleotidyltransferase [Deltaproteobacteria bacterium]HRS57203.1 polyribonucleotide nucleotidyltransferase [Desulfomonilia bacterium]HPD20212.1 polyribonucleotide nucleotidyltransferase [Deltaproteobacteria bacterium]HPX19234.1 polyribonucleotide nucleotidyltransferase [Deltaproteobacteria bacterium]